MQCLSNAGSVWYVGVLCCEILLLLNMANMGRLLCIDCGVSTPWSFNRLSEDTYAYWGIGDLELGAVQ